MEKKSNWPQLAYWLSIIGVVMIALLPLHEAKAGSLVDTTDPVVMITSPTNGPSYETSEASIVVKGSADDDSAIVLIEWETDKGFSGITTGFTSWIGPWYWEKDFISLLPGNNVITVRAHDVVGNTGEDQLVVTYTEPGPQPPPSETKGLDPSKSKVKMAVYKDEPDPEDHVSVVTYLIKGSDEQFVMPMAMDVTVTMKVPDPDNPGDLIQIFTQTIPANTIGSNYSKYRYTNSGPGIRELTFQKSTSTRVYNYVYVESVDFLASVREDFKTNDPGGFPANYTAWLKDIESLNFTVQTGDIAWSGDIPLEPEDKGSRVEYLWRR